MTVTAILFGIIHVYKSVIYITGDVVMYLESFWSFY